MLLSPIYYLHNQPPQMNSRERLLQLYMLTCLSLYGMALNMDGIIVDLIMGAMLTIRKKV